jgi:hypothetical protein
MKINDAITETEVILEDKSLRAEIENIILEIEQ